jgi:hypothetical protein
MDGGGHVLDDGMNAGETGIAEDKVEEMQKSFGGSWGRRGPEELKGTEDGAALEKMAGGGVDGSRTEGLADEGSRTEGLGDKGWIDKQHATNEGGVEEDEGVWGTEAMRRQGAKDACILQALDG